MQQCGTLIIEPWQSESGTSVPSDVAADNDNLPPLIKASWQSAIQHGIPVEFLDPVALKKRYPQFQQQPQYGGNGDNEWVGLLEPGGGFLRVNAIQDVIVRQLRERERQQREDPEAAMSNVDILENTLVESLSYDRDGDNYEQLVTLKIRQCHPEEKDEGGKATAFNHRTVTTKCLLVSMGAWTRQMFPSWTPYLKVKRQLHGWIHVKDQQSQRNQSEGSISYNYHDMPAYVVYVPHACPKHIYGVPCDDDDHDGEASKYLLKMGIHGREDLVDKDPTCVHQQEITKAEHVEVSRVAKAVFGMETSASQN